MANGRYMWEVINKYFFAYCESENLAKEIRNTDPRLAKAKIAKIYVIRTDNIENGEVIERRQPR